MFLNNNSATTFLQKSLMEKELAKKPKVGEQMEGIKYTVFK